MMGTMELNRYASIDTLAHEIFEELREHLQRGGSFAPVLFLHRFEGEDEPELLEMLTLEGEEQANWPDIIQEAVDRTEASLWALATQVVVRKTSVSRGGSSEELLFVYVVADAAQPASARIWATPLEPGKRQMEAFSEHTEDPRLQLMVAHLTGRRLLH